jgi:hypothetical protein
MKDSYQQILHCLMTLADDRSVRTDSRAKISGLLKAAKCATTYFGLLACDAIFRPCEAVARQLQGVGVTALGATECATVLISRIEQLRSDDKVQCLVQQTNCVVDHVNLKMPGLSRTHKTTARYRQTDRAEDFVEETTEHMWRRSYYEALDLVTGELKRRFDQSGLAVAAQRERLLIRAAQTTLSDEPDLPPLPSGINKRRLGAELMMLNDLCRDKNIQDIQTLGVIFAASQPETRRVFSSVEQLLALCLCCPISVAGSERSFSALRRLKTWVRSNMTQTRLSNLALMHIHSDILDTIDVDALVEEFCSRTSERRSVFGS